jgi:hypothetical protein
MTNLKPCLAVLFFTSGIAGCRDAAAPVENESEQVTQRLVCNVGTSARTVICSDPIATNPNRSSVIIGGPNGYKIWLRSSNVAVTADTFAFDVTIQNLVYQWLGSADGVTVDTAGIKIFFHDTLRVERRVDPAQPAFMRVLSDGRATFGGDTTDFYRYPEKLAHCQTSQARRWKFLFANVDSFSFGLKVSAQALGSLPNTCEHDQGGGG